MPRKQHRRMTQDLEKKALFDWEPKSFENGIAIWGFGASADVSENHCGYKKVSELASKVQIDQLVVVSWVSGGQVVLKDLPPMSEWYG